MVSDTAQQISDHKHTIRVGWSSIIPIHKEISIFTFSFNQSVASILAVNKEENTWKRNCMQKYHTQCNSLHNILQWNTYHCTDYCSCSRSPHALHRTCYNIHVRVLWTLYTLYRKTSSTTAISWTLPQHIHHALTLRYTTQSLVPVLLTVLSS